VTGFIDWTEGKISLYVFEKKGGGYSYADTVSVTVEGNMNQSVLSSLVKTNIERIYLSIPVNLLSLRELTFPFDDKNKIKDTLPFELEGILLGETANYTFDHTILESSDTTSRALAACIEKTRLKDIIDLFSSVGLEPVGVSSLDLRLLRGDIERIFESPSFDEKTRIEAAREELLQPTVDLRQGELAYRGDIERFKKSLRFTAVLFLLLFLIFSSYACINYTFTKKENTILKEKMITLYHSVFPEDSRVVDVTRQFRGNLNALKNKKEILGGISVLDILLNIASVEIDSIILNEVKADNNNILIKGTALTFEDVDSLKNGLNFSFTDIKVIDSSSSADKKIRFSLTMKDKTP
jgi:type II secretory pathway component PulL